MRQFRFFLLLVFIASIIGLYTFYIVKTRGQSRVRMRRLEVVQQVIDGHYKPDASGFATLDVSQSDLSLNGRILILPIASNITAVVFPETQYRHQNFSGLMMTNQDVPASILVKDPDGNCLILGHPLYINVGERLGPREYRIYSGLD